MEQLISYIAPSAPATRRPATGNELPVRVEIGFTPNWYRSKLGIDFSEQWHNDPKYRKETLISMRNELDTRFPGRKIGVLEENSIDLLTGVYGACTIAAIYGIPIIYSKNNWPNCIHQPLNDLEIKALTPPDLDNNPFFQKLMKQLDWIGKDQGKIIGFLNWQGVLNNAQRLRGEQLLIDMFVEPELVMHLMNCVCTTMIDAAKQLHKYQKRSHVDYQFFTVSNCLVNMISPEQYRDFVMPFDIKIAQAFGSLGIHNCAWNADPYMEYYAQIPNLGYIDMGIKSNMESAKKSFPKARRAIMYTPMDLNSKSLSQIRQDLERIAQLYAPCDVVLADIEDGMPDEKIIQLLNIVEKI
ncbi:MAG TPA: hypothetical protein DHV48_05205 [Prolixibacteraceae bacterium]|nr:hypothetical protein [Prolixibacteraceae bacterium]